MQKFGQEVNQTDKKTETKAVFKRWNNKSCFLLFLPGGTPFFATRAFRKFSLWAFLVETLVQILECHLEYFLWTIISSKIALNKISIQYLYLTDFVLFWKVSVEFFYSFSNGGYNLICILLSWMEMTVIGFGFYPCFIWFGRTFIE